MLWEQQRKTATTMRKGNGKGGNCAVYVHSYNNKRGEMRIHIHIHNQTARTHLDPDPKPDFYTSLIKS